jgi:peptidoglycan/xylan/chitin deacetylase (PgdA/CDA1 family)
MFKGLKRIAKSLLLITQLNRILFRIRPLTITVGYHRITDANNKLLAKRIGSTKISDFREQIDYLEGLGFIFVQLREIVSNKGTAKSRVAVTFDDGFRDVHDHAFPLLTSKGIPFSIFLISSLPDSKDLLWQHEIYALLECVDSVSGLERINAILEGLGQGHRLPTNIDDAISLLIHESSPRQIRQVLVLMRQNFPKLILKPKDLYPTWDELSLMADGGAEIQAHGNEHWNLTGLNGIELAHEISECARLIAERIGKRPDFYAVAHGRSTPKILNVIASLGFEWIIDGSLGDGSNSENNLINRIWPHGSRTELSWMLTRLWFSALLLSARNLAGATFIFKGSLP